MRMAFNLGLSIGPFFAGALIELYGYNLIFIVDSMTCFCAGIFLILFVKDAKKTEVKKTVDVTTVTSESPYTDMKFMLFMFFSLCMLVSFFQILFTVPLFMAEELGYTERHVGYFFGVNGLLIFLTEMPLVHYLEQRYDNFRVMKIGALMMGVAILIFIFPLPSIVSIVFYTLFVSYGEIINFPFIASTSMDRASDHNIGKYMSVNTVMFSTSLILAPIVGTALLEQFGYTALFSFMFLLCIISIVGLKFLKEEFYPKDGIKVSS
jgi:predicted MFS family arabinose efflux permease